VHLGGKAASFIGSSFRPAHARSCGPEFDALAAQSTLRPFQSSAIPASRNEYRQQQVSVNGDLCRIALGIHESGWLAPISAKSSVLCSMHAKWGALRHTTIRTTGDVYVQMIETSILNAMNSRTLEILADWKPAILDGKVTAINGAAPKWTAR